MPDPRVEVPEEAVKDAQRATGSTDVWCKLALQAAAPAIRKQERERVEAEMEARTPTGGAPACECPAKGLLPPNQHATECPHRIAAIAAQLERQRVEEAVLSEAAIARGAAVYTEGVPAILRAALDTPEGSDG
jgi:hypothetical protein